MYVYLFRDEGAYDFWRFLEKTYKNRRYVCCLRKSSSGWTVKAIRNYWLRQVTARGALYNDLVRLAYLYEKTGTTRQKQAAEKLVVRVKFTLLSAVGCI